MAINKNVKKRTLVKVKAEVIKVDNDSVKPPKRSKKKTKKKRVKLSQEQKDKNAYRNDVRSIFTKAGFTRVVGVSDKEFSFQEKYKTDFDDAFVYENIVVFVEYTLTQSSGISAHIKPKKLTYNAILENTDEFLDFYSKRFPSFKDSRNSLYDDSQTRVVILYCSKNDVDYSIKAIVDNVKYLDYPNLKYFKSVTDAVKLSSKYELLKFLGFEFSEIGANVLNTSSNPVLLNGTILPESQSNFPPGYKVVSFYIDPETLLKNSYVLRKDGWKEEGGLYQRMISKKKVNSIRNYLSKEKRVFINNIIVTLPPETSTLEAGKQNKVIDPKHLKTTAAVKILVPNEFNTIGLIDGQHRVFAYHEGGDNDLEIDKLRKRQNLLATGIIYPSDITEIEKSKFEANLFLEINTNQTTANSELKQAIGLLLSPFASESVAKAIIYRLHINGPLAGKFERHFYEKEKLKPTSIVSYGLKPIVKFKGSDSFYHIWDNPNKQNLIFKIDDVLLKDYIDFCATHINTFLGAMKELLPVNKWSIVKPEGILSTTTINGLIICLRKLIANDKIGDFKFYKSKFSPVKNFDFTGYKSSQYGKMADDLYKKVFN